MNLKVLNMNKKKMNQGNSQNISHVNVERELDGRKCNMRQKWNYGKCQCAQGVGGKGGGGGGGGGGGEWVCKKTTKHCACKED